MSVNEWSVGFFTWRGEVVEGLVFAEQPVRRVELKAADVHGVRAPVPAPLQHGTVEGGYHRCELGVTEKESPMS